MHQAKVSSFFQRSSTATQSRHQSSKVIEASELLSLEKNDSSPIELAFEDSNLVTKRSRVSSSSCPSKNLRKRRIYEQYHLDLGQSDFILHTCSVCGLMYARGVDEDEKVHKKFHQDYDKGIQFKGWNHERVVFGSLCNGDRILLILDSDPPIQKHVVQKVVNLTKKELGFTDDTLIHALCKVFLFISAHRIVGWLVAEPIKTAHRVISRSSSSSNFDDVDTEITTKAKTNGSESKKTLETTLQFGNIKFHREIVKKSCPTTCPKLTGCDAGAIICDEEAVPAKCGVRAVWVVPSSRRKRVASQLMDSVRRNFCPGVALDISQCAFSPPTSAGMAFASQYMKTRSVLVYREDDL